MPELLPPCPRCGRNSLVRHGNDHICCLSCPYQRDLTESPTQSVELGIFFWACLLLFGIGIGAGAADWTPPNRSPKSCILP